MQGLNRYSNMKNCLWEFFTPVSGEPISLKKIQTASFIRLAVVIPTIFLLTFITMITYKNEAYHKAASAIILEIWLIQLIVYIVLNIFITNTKKRTIAKVLTLGCIIIEFSTNQLCLYALGSLTTHATIFLAISVGVYRIFFDYYISIFGAATCCVFYAGVAYLELHGIIPLTPYLPTPLQHKVYSDPWMALSFVLAIIFSVFITFFITNYSMNQITKLNRYIMQKLSEEKRKAVTDALTGLYNRRYFDEQLKRVVDEALIHSYEVSLIMMDIDDFKKYNDTFGHQAGDHVIAQIAEIASRCVRSTDIVARYGGEEFVIIMEHTDSSAAFKIAERIRSSVENLPLDIIKMELTVSIGIGTFPIHAGDIESLVKYADKSLYYSKHSGKNRVCYGWIEEGIH